jgi:hypothetical protein
MKTYTLDQSQLNKEKKSIILMYGITLLILIALAVSINWGRDTMQSLLWLIPLMAAMYVFMGFRSYKQRKAFYEGYSIQLTEDELIQNQPRMRELKFALADVTNVEMQKKGLLVSIKQAKNVLGISKETMKPADFDEIKNTLMDWAKRNTSQQVEIENLPAETVIDVTDAADEVNETAQASANDFTNDNN